MYHFVFSVIYGLRRCIKHKRTSARKPFASMLVPLMTEEVQHFSETKIGASKVFPFTTIWQRQHRVQKAKLFFLL